MPSFWNLIVGVDFDLVDMTNTPIVIWRRGVRRELQSMMSVLKKCTRRCRTSMLSTENAAVLSAQCSVLSRARYAEFLGPARQSLHLSFYNSVNASFSANIS